MRVGDTSSDQRVGRLARVLMRLACIAGAFVATLALCELALRVLGIPGTLDQEWLLQSSSDNDRVFDPETLMTKPGFRRASHYRTAGGEKVVVALGDSFTDGFGVASDQSYPAVLGRSLREAGLEVRVIDMGLGYSGSDMQLALLKDTVLPRLRPDVLIWQLCANDPWENVELSLYRVEGTRLVHHGVGRNWLYVRDRIHRGLPAPLGFLRRTQLYRLLLDATKLLWASEVPPEYEGRLLEYGHVKAQLVFDELIQLSREYEFELFIACVDLQAVHLPPEELASSGTPDWCVPNYETLRAMVSGYEGFIDTRFTEADRAEARDRHPEVGNSIGHGFFLSAAEDPATLGQRHYNEVGYEVFATKIARDLVQRRGVLSGE